VGRKIVINQYRKTYLFNLLLITPSSQPSASTLIALLLFYLRTHLLKNPISNVHAKHRLNEALSLYFTTTFHCQC